MTTAVVKVQTKQGKFIVARALLDSCSTVNLITEQFAGLLNLPKLTCAINIGAVDGLCTVSKQYIRAIFHSNYNSFKHELNFLIVPNIADAVPNDAFPRSLFDIPKNLTLADPQFHLPKPVDILLASSTTLSILAVGQIKLNHEKARIILQKTRLGWIVAGGVDLLSSHTPTACHMVKLDKLIERFWIIEDFDHEPVKSRDEVTCEKHYAAHTTRDPITGRYTVRLCFRDNKFNLGESRPQALKRYYALERKFQSNPILKAEYTRVMDDFISQGHMTICEDDTNDGYFLPHHAVLKESSQTTKCRVVFDASAKTSTGISLNDTLIVDPTIQNTVFEQVLRFRTHKYVITADIEKMYRQILIHPDDRKFQKVLWPIEGKLRTLQLNRVAFGTSAAPFLAIRTLQQLARDEAHDFPRASKLLLRDFYVDDFISGADSLEEILTIRDEMIELLRRGGFHIRQWASNHQSALDTIDKEILELDWMVRENSIQKTLGIIWDSKNDVFRYLLQPIDPLVAVTKRKLLSEVSKIFDPLGLLGPVILFAKVLIQDCWKAKITWDESLPQDIHTKWTSLAYRLPCLKEISIPRQFLGSNSVKIDIHGFCDACTYGYGACLYARSVDSQGQVLVRLICSKSRVAPLNKVTIPRLELCAASILKNLYVASKSQFDFPIDQVVCWSDSTIVLCWLKKAPHLLRTFESNRVSDIQSVGDEVQWRHVRSEDNPADSLSRGQLPSEFLKNSIWGTGPRWLSCPEEEWPPLIESALTDLPGLKKGVCFLTQGSFDEMFLRFSSYSRLLKVISRVLQFTSRIRSSWKETKAKGRPLSEKERRERKLFPEICDDKHRMERIIELMPPIDRLDIERTELRILSLVQLQSFSREIKLLSTARDLSPDEISRCAPPFRKATKFDEIVPFLDENNLIRVGGRLKKSALTYNQKHPILLPSCHHVSDLIIRGIHETNLHSGIQSTLYQLRERFWVLNGRNQVRRITRRCVECIRQRPKFTHATMTDLPESRVTETPAFNRTGVDFFGPILIKEKRDRNRSFIKTYGCVFMCMVSKAVHIELATDLSTEGFLAAFRRFISRRGVPEHTYSDNGTNFVGANKELSEILKSFDTPEFKRAIGNFALAKRIDWHFNPPLSPHFGGLWEAAVKSFKHHLKRVLKDQRLTYEQINTLLIEIEAILNSRPLCTLSADPNDPLAITPAHLLIGRPFNFLPENSVVSVPDNRLSTYKFITKAREDFWNKWHKEYLHELQTRQKWHSSNAELTVGSVVILMEDNLGCARWPLGVIVEVFPGSDGVARVALIKTASGVHKRNITRLCVLSVT